MPEHLRALVVILVLATGVFAVARAPACAHAMREEDFKRRRNLWFAITLVAFLSHNFWIYIVVTAALLLHALPREPNKLAMYYFLLFAVPAIPGEITGLGVIKHFFTIDYVRLLALVVLFPLFLSLRERADVDRFGTLLPDKLIAGYIALNFFLIYTASTFTNTLRHGAFYAFIDMFLPYYVASRSPKDLQAFRDTLMSFVLAALILSAFGMFELARHWLLYSSLDDVFGMQWGYGNYLERGTGTLRAQATTGHAIALGYVVAVAAGFFLYLRAIIPSRLMGYLGLAALTVGIVAPVSRGPWVGAGVMLLAFIAAGPNPVTRLGGLGLAGGFCFLILLVSPAGEKVLDYLPFVGTVEAENVTYRQRLLEISIQFILQNPLFAASDFMYSPAMQEMKQGQGIVDIVNTYLGIGLSSGLTGLSLFAGFFITVAVVVFRGMRVISDGNDERHRLGQALLATLIGILVIIGTTSSITVVPAVYWSVAGLAVAYARMLSTSHAPGAEAPTVAQPALNRTARYPGSGTGRR